MKNVPASSPRDATTVGIPRPARNTPRGSSTRSDGREHEHRGHGDHRAEDVGVLARPAQRGHPEPRHPPRPPRPCRAGRPAVAAAGPSAPDRGRHQRQRDPDERHEPEEHPVPRQGLGDQPGHRRPEQRRQHPRRGDQPEHRGPQPLRVDRGDQHERRDGQRARAEALQHPAQRAAAAIVPARARDQQAHPEQQRCRRGSAPAGPRGPHQRPPSTVAEHRGREEGDERPRVQRHRAEVGHQRGHRGADAHRLERHQADQQDEPDRRGPPLGPEQLGADGVGVVGVAVTHG